VVVDMKNHHNKGDRKAQRKRQRERRKHLPQKQTQKVMLIDGNLSYYPIAYCRVHGGYLTEGLIDTHRCTKRKCDGFEALDGGDGR